MLNLHPNREKKRANVKKAVIVGGAAVTAGLAVYGSVKLKKYLDNKRRIEAGELFALRLQNELDRRMFEQQQVRDAAREAQRKVEQRAADAYLNGLGDRLMDTFKQQNGLA